MNENAANRTPGRALDDADLLSRLLKPGQKTAVARGLSQRLLQRFGGLRPLLAASEEALSAIEGMNASRVAALGTLPELARRYFAQTLPVGDAIKGPEDTETFLRARLQDLPHEVFCCLFLDNRHRVIGFAELFRGTIDGTSVYPREVVKEALAVNAAAVIFAHNHPSGVAEPSRADEQITRRLQSALSLVDIRVLDHMIIGDAAITSLACRGMLGSQNSG